MHRLTSLATDSRRPIGSRSNHGMLNAPAPLPRLLQKKSSADMAPKSGNRFFRRELHYKRGNGQ